MMSHAQAAILGIVEGITEFLPVSSTGHLILAGKFLGLEDEASKSFEVAIQSGAIFAVLILYWRRFAGLLDFKSRQAMHGLPGISRLALTSIPVLALAFVARKPIKAHLFTPETVVLALVLGGIAILWVESRPQNASAQNSLDDLSYRQALLIGCIQCLALWPGMSRSAMTILGGVLLGLRRQDAAEYSFLVAVPVLFAATGYELAKPILKGESLGIDPAVFLTGVAVSFLVALITVKLFTAILAKISLKPFAWYRILVAPLYYFMAPK
jgi:undecaprenyl-diphosphatase